MADSNSIDLKTCTKCKQEKPLREFGNRTISKDGLQLWCRSCKSTSGQAYYLENKDRLEPIRAAWEVANAGPLKVYRAEYYQANRTRLDKINAAWSKSHPKERAKWSLIDYKKHKQKRLVAFKKYQEKNAESIRVQKVAYRAANPELFASLARAYRARKSGAEGSHTSDDIKNLFKLQRGACIYCVASIKAVYHIDHVIPLSRGGRNDRSNLQLLCPRCNMRKKDKEPHVFAQEMGRLI